MRLHTNLEKTMPSSWTLRLRCLLVLLAGAPPLAAQQTSPAAHPTRVPVTLALAEQVPDSGTPFLIKRNPGRTPLDLIVLSADADAAVLSDAVRALLLVRRAAGDTAIAPANMRVRPRALTVSQPAFPWADRVIGDLRRAELRPVPGVGMARAVTIWLPAQRPPHRPN